MKREKGFSSLLSVLGGSATARAPPPSPSSPRILLEASETLGTLVLRKMGGRGGQIFSLHREESQKGF